MYIHRNSLLYNLHILIHTTMSESPMSNLEKVLSGERIPIPDDFVPGTVHLIDIHNAFNVKKDLTSKKNIILQPQPSSNPNDPLRWSNMKKKLQFGFLFVCIFSIFSTLFFLQKLRVAVAKSQHTN